ncbi:MAG: hypothetical protein KBT39_01695 [Bacteroidales bacterium]|nr:hypothetical protein [Bacteroidales bacterium]
MGSITPGKLANFAIYDTDFTKAEPDAIWDAQVKATYPKIIVASMTTRYEACLDVKGEYIAGKSTSIILGETKYLYKLTAIINSKLASYWLNVVFNSLKMSGGAINIGRNAALVIE